MCVWTRVCCDMIVQERWSVGE